MIHQATTGFSYSFEIYRKAIHLACLAIPMAYLYLDYEWILILTGSLLAIALATEILRLSMQRAGRVFLTFFGAMLRPGENRSITAATYLFLSCFLCVLLFHKYVAIFALAGFIAGDGMAGLVGKPFGRTPLFNKSAEGFLSCLITVLVMALFFPVLPLLVKLTGALLISVVEVIPMHTNDNIRVPLMAGSMMELLYIIGLKDLSSTEMGLWI